MKLDVRDGWGWGDMGGSRCPLVLCVNDVRTIVF